MVRFRLKRSVQRLYTNLRSRGESSNRRFYPDTRNNNNSNNIRHIQPLSEIISTIAYTYSSSRMACGTSSRRIPIVPISSLSLQCCCRSPLSNDTSSSSSSIRRTYSSTNEAISSLQSIHINSSSNNIDDDIMSSSSSSNTPSIDLWKQMIQIIPLSMILPIGMIPSDMIIQQQANTELYDVANRRAFYGDKILNYYISQHLRQRHLQNVSVRYDDNDNNDDDPIQNNKSLTTEQIYQVHNNLNNISSNKSSSPSSSSYTAMDIGYLTLVQSEAMSNQLYAQHFDTIMSSHTQITTELHILAKQQYHNASTMIEATVDALFNQISYKNNNNNNSNENDTSSSTVSTSLYTKTDAENAIRQLANYLVHVAHEQSTYLNAKGQLLELGGTVISYKTDNSIEHYPKFRAIATYQSMSYISDPPSSTKKMAEQIAATYILRQCQHLQKGITDNSSAPSSSSTTATTPDNINGNKDDEINITNFDVDLMEDGALPDDFYSDISKIASKKNKSNNDNDNDDDTSVVDRPYDAQRFQLPKLNKRTQIDFYHFNNTHTVNLKDGESPELSWRRGAYDKRSCFHRAILASKMLPNHIETVNSWTRPGGKDLFTVVVILIPKPKTIEEKKRIYPTIKCFVRHDVSRNRARNALGMVINQYIDQVIIGNTITQVLEKRVQPEKKLWPIRDRKNQEKIYQTNFRKDDDDDDNYNNDDDESDDEMDDDDDDDDYMDDVYDIDDANVQHKVRLLNKTMKKFKDNDDDDDDDDKTAIDKSRKYKPKQKNKVYDSWYDSTNENDDKNKSHSVKETDHNNNDDKNGSHSDTTNDEIDVPSTTSIPNDPKENVTLSSIST